MVWMESVKGFGQALHQWARLAAVLVQHAARRGSRGEPGVHARDLCDQILRAPSMVVRFSGAAPRAQCDFPRYERDRSSID